MKCQILFSRKNIKKQQQTIINADLAQRMVKVKLATEQMKVAIQYMKF